MTTVKPRQAHTGGRPTYVNLSASIMKDLLRLGNPIGQKSLAYGDCDFSPKCSEAKYQLFFRGGINWILCPKHYAEWKHKHDSKAPS